MKAFNDIQSHDKRVKLRNFELIVRKGTQRIECPSVDLAVNISKPNYLRWIRF